MNKKSTDTLLRCTIDWHSFSQPETWETKLHTIVRSNLLQSADYAQAAATVNHQRIRRGLIRIEGRDAGMLQILEAGILKNAVHGVLIDRAPLWFENFGNMIHMESFLQALNHEFPRRFGRKLRFIPEIPDNAATRAMLTEYGFIQKSQEGYETVWIDLRADSDTLRSRIKANWRGALRKAERQQDMNIIFDDSGLYFPWLMTQYASDKAQRRYDGPSVKLMQAMGRQFLRGKNMLIGCALLDKNPIAAILIFIHGSSATYQIGYTSHEGRERCAHHKLLWDALAALKERAIDDFDLGGVNDGDAQGVKAFKIGLGGRLVKTPGLYGY